MAGFHKFFLIVLISLVSKQVLSCTIEDYRTRHKEQTLKVINSLVQQAAVHAATLPSSAKENK